MFAQNNSIDSKYIKIHEHNPTLAYLEEGGQKLGGVGRKGSYLKTQAGEVNLENMQWDGQVRKMKNGDIVLPFSVALVMKKFENFDMKNFKADLKMTLNMRVKFAGLKKIL